MELALTLAVLGIVALVAWRHGANLLDRQSAAQSRVLLERAEAAVRAHAFVHARLPCPAADAQGLEACDGRTEGFLPRRTLGLPDASAGRVRYRVDSTRLSRAGAVPFPVLVPIARGGGDGLAAERVPLHDTAAPGGDRTLDFCAALGAPEAPNAPNAHGMGADVAFSMSLPASPLVGPSATVQPRGDAESQTRVARRSTLWSDLSCAGLVATAGRAHFNARLQAAVMRQAIGDYRRQSDVALGLSEWDLSQSHWLLANSAYGAAKTGIKLDIARSAWLASLRTDPASAIAMGLAATALATSVLHMAINASTFARGSFNLSNARAHRDALDRLAARAASLERQIARRAALGGSDDVVPTRRQVEPSPGAPAWLEAEAAALSADAPFAEDAAPDDPVADGARGDAPAASPADDPLSREARRYREAIGRL